MRTTTAWMIFAVALVASACGDNDKKHRSVDASADACTPRTCGGIGGACGAVDDGCGGLLNCPCACDGGACCASTQTCEQLGASCGTTLDRCGKRLACGACAADQTCGAAGTNRCGTGLCAAKQCTQGQCGQLSNGCDGVLDCGVCASGQECVNNQCQACATSNCVTQTSCTPASYLADCPQRPCQEVEGCQGNTCTYRPFACATSNSCPFEECEATPSVQGSRTYYTNQCIRKDNHECTRTQPGGETISGTCRGNACVAAQELQLVEGRIEPLAGPSLESAPMRRLLDQSLYFGQPTPQGTTGSGAPSVPVCDQTASRCLVGGFTAEGT